MRSNSAETAQVENTTKQGISVEKSSAPIDRRLSVAPMMEWSDRHCRYFFRLLAPRTLLYTEMIVAEAIVRGHAARRLAFDATEQPLALQLGGSDPATLAEAARAGAERGFAEINLNVGCPSDRVQSATFGACLMARPARVADCVAAMRAAVAIPVTVKCRIGIDEQEGDEFLSAFVDRVAGAGCDTSIVHARKAMLAGLSPRENREIPPLRYDVVARLKAARPQLTIVINGGIRTQAAVEAQWAVVDGVMIGREAYHNPYFLAALDRAAWPRGAEPVPEPSEVIDQLRPYVERELGQGTRLHSITRHILGLYAGLPGARLFRRVLSERGTCGGAGWEVLAAARDAAGDRHRTAG